MRERQASILSNICSLIPWLPIHNPQMTILEVGNNSDLPHHPLTPSFISSPTNTISIFWCYWLISTCQIPHWNIIQWIKLAPMTEQLNKKLIWNWRSICYFWRHCNLLQSFLDPKSMQRNRALYCFVFKLHSKSQGTLKQNMNIEKSNILNPLS